MSDKPITARAKQWGENIATFRTSPLFGYTQEQLAERLGVTRNTVCMWESGRRTPTDDHKARLAHELRTDVRVLFPLFPEPEPRRDDEVAA